MTVINFIRNFPEINKRDEKYYLYLGMISGLTAKETLKIVNHCLNQDILKRKVLLNKVIFTAAKWTIEENNSIFNEIYNSKDQLLSYFKKETASMILMVLFPHVSVNNQDKVIKDFSQSRYINNRKRVYKYFYKNWSPKCTNVIEKAWTKYKDEDAIGLIVAKMPKAFLLKNFDEILTYFDEESLTYDFFLKILRNKLYIRLYDDIPSNIKILKDNDPLSFVYIMKESKKKLDTSWAIKTYKQFYQSRFLARWYSEMGLWEDILKEKPDFLSEIKH